MIDLYQIHAPVPGIEIEPAWEAMAGLVDDGLVRFIGVSNFEQGIGVISYGPLAFGVLTGAITAETRSPPDDWRSGNTRIPPVRAMYEALFAPDVIAGHLAAVDALRPVADRLGTSLAQLALAWAIHRPGVTGVICGTRSPERAPALASPSQVGLNWTVASRTDV